MVLQNAEPLFSRRCADEQRAIRRREREEGSAEDGLLGGRRPLTMCRTLCCQWLALMRKVVAKEADQLADLVLINGADPADARPRNAAAAHRAVAAQLSSRVGVIVSGC